MAFDAYYALEAIVFCRGSFFLRTSVSRMDLKRDGGRCAASKMKDPVNITQDSTKIESLRTRATRFSNIVLLFRFEKISTILVDPL